MAYVEEEKGMLAGIWVLLILAAVFAQGRWRARYEEAKLIARVKGEAVS